MKGSVVLTLALALVVTAGAAAQTFKPPRGAVAGTFDRSCILGCGDKELVRFLKVSNVWCKWNGEDFVVHLTLRNTSDAGIKVKVQPRYRILRAGLHGDGFGSISDVHVDARGFKSWYIVKDKPKGVKPKARITACIPKLFDVSADD